MTQTSATGLSARQRGLSSPAATTKTSAASATESQAWVSVSAPRGSSRFRVRGFRASRWRSAMRLKPMATHRAAEKATTTSATVRPVTGATRAAASTPSSAKGSANRVCGSLTKLT